MPHTWHKMDRDLPENALSIGRNSDGRALFAGRMSVEGGGVQVGKVLKGVGLHIGYGGQELLFETGFEVLCSGESSACTSWAKVVDESTSETFMNMKPIPAGHEHDDTPLFVAVCHDSETNSFQVGKCSSGWLNCSFGYGGQEKWSTTSYFVLIERE